MLTLDVSHEATVISGLGSKIIVTSNYVSYEGRIGAPVNKILFVPHKNPEIKLVVATRNKGVYLIDLLQFKSKN